ncbi:FecR domain-containing protein [Candidatus Roizmanbacteria bacterium]|nr:FecR domain-containing protein [Candidatus Roizmanbacteria bacterium]
MKKLILPLIIVAFVLLLPNTLGNVRASHRGGKSITCKEAKKIMGTPKCPYWSIGFGNEGDIHGMWCASDPNYFSRTDNSEVPQLLFPRDNPTYSYVSGDSSCLGDVPNKQDDKSGQETKPQDSQPPDGKNTSNKASSEDGNPFSIFGINPFETWLNLKKLAEVGVFVKSGAAERFAETVILHSVGKEPTWEREARESANNPFSLKNLPSIEELSAQKLSERQPTISKEDETAAWGFLQKYTPREENITVVKGQGQIKLPNSDQFISVLNTSATSDTVSVTFYNSVLRNSTNDATQLLYAWGTDFGAVVSVSPQSEIRFLEPIQDKTTQELKRMVKLNKGELEIKVKNANSKDKFGVQTDFLDLIVIGTHFWVKNDPDRKLTLVGVYDGKVEVKTKDGQTTTGAPNGEKPGVVVVSQKLSVTKLTLTGLVLAMIVGGAIVILRRK